MNILKPQIKYIERLNNKEITDIKSNEDLEEYNFESEECNNIELWDLKLEYCKFNHICMQNGKLEKVTFRDVIFENCDFQTQNLLNQLLLDVNLETVKFLVVIYLKTDYIMFHLRKQMQVILIYQWLVLKIYYFKILI